MTGSVQWAAQNTSLILARGVLDIPAVYTANRMSKKVYIIILELNYTLRNFLRNRKLYLGRKFRDLSSYIFLF